jgi:hypothetical protein
VCQGSGQIPCRDIGYVLRILGQNPTEDEIVEMVLKVKTTIIFVLVPPFFFLLGPYTERIDL